MTKTLFAAVRARGPGWIKNLSMREQPDWTPHAEFMNRLAAEGFVVLGGPLGEGGDVLLVVNAPDEATVRATLARDPWSESQILAIKSVQPWTILLEADEHP